MHPKDVLVILLIYIRRYPWFEEMAVYLGMKVSTLQKIIEKAIDAASKQVKKCYIHGLALDILPTRDPFFECTLIVDATVQEIPRPLGSFEEAKVWFSGKHGMYCIKTQVTINRAGMAVHIVSGIPGSVHDVIVLKNSLPEIDDYLSQFPNDPHKILADKGYISEDLKERLITPHKGNRLTHEQMLFNEKLSKVRIKVENYFGRLKNYFMIISEKFRGNRESYDSIFCLCAGLVNFQIKYLNKPLNREDHDFFCRHYTMVHMNVNKRKQKEAEKRKNQKEARMLRMALN